MKPETYEKCKKVGTRISYYRKLKGLTQEELGAKIGKSRSFISSIESPRMDKTIYMEYIFDIANVLEVPISKLFYFD